jgi:hypothetical protein
MEYKTWSLALREELRAMLIITFDLKGAWK